MRLGAWIGVGLQDRAKGIAALLVGSFKQRDTLQGTAPSDLQDAYMLYARQKSVCLSICLSS